MCTNMPSLHNTREHNYSFHTILIQCLLANFIYIFKSGIFEFSEDSSSMSERKKNGTVPGGGPFPAVIVWVFFFSFFFFGCCRKIPIMLICFHIPFIIFQTFQYSVPGFDCDVLLPAYYHAMQMNSIKRVYNISENI